jgi:uncharacterized cofD-like protein
VGGVADALRKAAALRVYIGNLMTEPGETDGLTLADHLQGLYAHGGRGVLDGVVVHGPSFPADVLVRYQKVGARPVPVDRDRLHALGVWLAEADLTGPSELARHHPDKLGRVLVRLIGHGGPVRARGPAAALDERGGGS